MDCYFRRRRCQMRCSHRLCCTWNHFTVSRNQWFSLKLSYIPAICPPNTPRAPAGRQRCSCGARKRLFSIYSKVRGSSALFENGCVPPYRFLSGAQILWLIAGRHVGKGTLPCANLSWRVYSDLSKAISPSKAETIDDSVPVAPRSTEKGLVS